MFETTDRLYGLWARDGTQVWAVGEEGSILHSKDSGVALEAAEKRHRVTAGFHLRERLQLVDRRGGWHHLAFDGRRRALETAKERDGTPPVFGLCNREAGLGGR